jgi:homoserine dehydrogenase
MSNTQQVGLFGFGTVGRGYYEISLGHENPFVTPSAIVVKTEGKPRSLPAEHFSFDANDILARRDIGTVVELTPGGDDAYSIIARAFAENKAVVSANKKVIAERFPDLIRQRWTNGNTFLYEAAVAASVPILRLLDDYFSHQTLTSVRGILNGTSNYILSRIRREGSSFAEALQQAQAAGFAEADPSSDVEGWDATYKLVILTAHAFGLWIPPSQVPRLGISLISPEDIAFADAQGLRIKLVAAAEIGQRGTIQLSVLPRLVAADDALFQVEDEYNGILVESQSAGTQFYQGRGAGSLPSGTAVLWDVLAAAEGRSYALQRYHNGEAPSLDQEGEIPLVVALGTTLPGALGLKAEWVEPLSGGYALAKVPAVYLRAVLQAAQLRKVSVLHAGALVQAGGSVVRHAVSATHQPT